MTLVAVFAVLVGLLGGGMLGLALGRRSRGRPRRYWILNGMVVAVCMAADFAGLVQGWPWLAYGALGAMGGAITGLRYGFSESLAVWRSAGQAEGPDLRVDADDPASADDSAAS